MKNCILFVTHQINDFIDAQLRKLILDLNNDDTYELWVLFNTNDKIKSNTPYCNVFPFNFKTVQDAGFTLHRYYWYNSPLSFYGHNFEYSFMSFYKEHQEFDFYWLIEWDVYCNGNWKDLFTYYDNNHKDVDFYTTHISYGKNGNISDWQKDWTPLVTYHWIKTFSVNNDNVCRCFNPIDRFSNKALKILCDSYENGDYGFYEIAMPTIFINNNLNIKAFGKTTEYIADNRFIDDYSDGHFEFINDDTDRYTPQFKYKNELEPGKIYHPVKSFLI